MMETRQKRRMFTSRYMGQTVILLIIFVFIFILYITSGTSSSWHKLSSFTNETVRFTTIESRVAPSPSFPNETVRLTTIESKLTPSPSFTNETERLTTTESKVTPSPVSLICDSKTTKISQPCLCYVDMDENVTDGLIVSRDDSRAVSNYSEFKCAMTVHPDGRLGNLMGQYASLYGLAKLNKRPAFMLPEMAQILSKYFKTTLPVLSQPMASRLQWTNRTLHDWMEDSYTRLEGQFTRLIGYPNAFTFYDHVAKEIKREFTLRDDIQTRAEHILRELAVNRSSTTFIGVHVRRGDYVKLMFEHYKGLLADTDFFVRATDYFRTRYKDAIFVVVSNGMEWCKKNIPNDRGDVHFIGDNDENNPIADFSLLINCNHTIFAFGSYGYWAAYLAGGEVIYLANFTLPDSEWHITFHDNEFYLPQWIPITADLSPLISTLTTSITPSSTYTPVKSSSSSTMLSITESNYFTKNATTVSSSPKL